MKTLKHVDWHENYYLNGIKDYVCSDVQMSKM